MCSKGWQPLEGKFQVFLCPCRAAAVLQQPGPLPGQQSHAVLRGGVPGCGAAEVQTHPRPGTESWEKKWEFCLQGSTPWSHGALGVPGLGVEVLVLFHSLLRGAWAVAYHVPGSGFASEAL